MDFFIDRLQRGNQGQYNHMMVYFGIWKLVLPFSLILFFAFIVSELRAKKKVKPVTVSVAKVARGAAVKCQEDVYREGTLHTPIIV